MASEELVIHGAREHNLKDITVRLPRNSLVCITGLSGSGKSSLAFDTIYAEGQRRYVESLSAYARQFLQMMEKPDVDSIDGLSPAISIDQKTTSRNPRSTVGTVTEIYDYLRLLYARVGRPHCPVCGRPISGQSIDSIVEQILTLPDGQRFTANALLVPDPSLSIDDGALVPWAVGGSGFYESVIQAIADRYEIPTDIPWQELTEEEQDYFLYGTDGEKVYVQYRNRMGRRRSYMIDFEGIISSLERRYRETDSSTQRERIEEHMSFRPCPVCKGARLKPEVLAVTVGATNIHEFTRFSITRALQFLNELGLTETEELIGHRIVKEIRERLTFLDDVGVGYLQLDRGSATLSGGEAQRLRLATQIGSQLVGVLYILDEPSIGLHQRDNDKLIGTLERLRNLGNTVMVVEHDEQMMRSAVWLVDMGPGTGAHGGHVIAEGTADKVQRNKKSVTGQYLSGARRIAIPQRRTADNGWFKVLGAAENNLKKINVDFPVGKFIAVTGVSGSGKSTLVNEIVYKALANQLSKIRVRPGAHKGVKGIEVFDKVITIDQRPIGRTPRSNPATYTDLFTHIRELYSLTPDAKVRGYKPGRFSFNVKGGRCETCKGDGQIKIEMHFLPDVYVPCETCKGRRYNRA